MQWGYDGLAGREENVGDKRSLKKSEEVDMERWNVSSGRKRK